MRACKTSIVFKIFNNLKKILRDVLNSLKGRILRKAGRDRENLSLTGSFPKWPTQFFGTESF